MGVEGDLTSSTITTEVPFNNGRHVSLCLFPRVNLHDACRYDVSYYDLPYKVCPITANEDPPSYSALKRTQKRENT